MQTIVDVVRCNAERFPNKVAYCFLNAKGEPEKKVSYKSLFDGICLIAVQLCEHIELNDRVILAFEPGVEFIQAFFACIKAGAIPVPVDMPRAGERIKHFYSIVGDCKPKIILAGARQAKKLNALEVSNYSYGAPVVVLKSQPSNMEYLLERSSQKKIPSELAFLQYTSGTTGKPKGVMVSHQNLLDNINLIVTETNLSESSVFATWLPMFHDMGLIAGLLVPASQGGTCYVMSPMMFLQKPLLWLQVISRYKVNLSGGPNFSYDLCVNRIKEYELKGLDLSSWKVAFSGAEVVRFGTVKAFCERFSAYGFSREALFPCYGMAEVTLYACGNYGLHSRLSTLANESENRNISVGIHSQKTGSNIIKIVEPNIHIEVDDGVEGEVWLAGQCVAQGYWGKPDLTREQFRAKIVGDIHECYLRTGDLGVIHNGRLFITGRIKEMILIRGKNYYPTDIEQCIQAHIPQLLDNSGAAFSVDTPKGEELVVVHEMNKEADFCTFGDLEVEVRKVLMMNFGLTLYDFVLIRAGTLMRTSSGKIKRLAVREKYLANELRKYEITKPRIQIA